MTTTTPTDSAPKFAGESRYRLLVEAVMDYAIYLLDPDGLVTSWNKGAERFKGYAASEIMGKHFSLFYTEEDRLAGVPSQALETARREGRFEAEGWRVHRSGRKFWCSVVIDAIRDDAGRLSGFAKITRDITDKKKAQEEVQAARDALHHAQKLEALGRLTGGVAHDFNNFLATIRFAAEMLRKPSIGEDRRVQLAGLIASTVERAGHLTAQLLAYARSQPLKPARFRVQACIEGMREIFSATVGTAVRIEYRLPETPLYVCADPSQLETALLNIVVNARDAMPRGGLLTIALRREADAVEPACADAEARPCIAIELRDSGCGMDPDVLARVFEPFFTTKPVDKGTGLGLSQVFGFARQSGGDVRVTSEVGVGSVFTLSIPEDLLGGDLREPVSESQTDATAGPPPSERKILLVEDEPNVGIVLHALLEDLGHEVSLCTDAGAALSLLHETNGAFDMMITDVEMAGVDGVELANQVRTEWPYIRVVLTTGSSKKMADMDGQAFPLLPKPWSPDLLIEMLQQR